MEGTMGRIMGRIMGQTMELTMERIMERIMGLIFMVLQVLETLDLPQAMGELGINPRVVHMEAHTHISSSSHDTQE